METEEEFEGMSFTLLTKKGHKQQVHTYIHSLMRRVVCFFKFVLYVVLHLLDILLHFVVLLCFYSVFSCVLFFLCFVVFVLT